jgi:hypothetical protein
VRMATGRASCDRSGTSRTERSLGRIARCNVPTWRKTSERRSFEGQDLSRTLKDAEVYALANGAVQRSFSKGQLIVREGEDGGRCTWSSTDREGDAFLAAQGRSWSSRRFERETSSPN